MHVATDYLDDVVAVVKVGSQRHGLAPGSEKSSVSDVAAATVGLHAARTISAFPIAAARLGDPTLVDSIRDYPATSGLVRIRCMRKTLHVLPVALAAVAHCATLRYRRRDSLTQLARHLDAAEIERLSPLLLDELSDGWHTQADVEAWFLRRAEASVPAWRLLLKRLWESGEVLCHNAAPAWNQELRQYLTTTSHFGADVLNTLDEATAERRLVEAYIRTYGPATVRDVAWWGGLSAGRVQAALAALPDVVAVTAPWCPSTLYVHTARLDDPTPDVADRWVRLVGGEDVAFKAYFESRNRYVRAEHYNQLFNAIGEALPAIVVDGQAAGLWRWERGRIRTWWFEKRVPARLQALLHAEVERLERLLQARSSRLGRARPSRGPRSRTLPATSQPPLGHVGRSSSIARCGGCLA